MSEREVDLIPQLTKGLQSEIFREIKEPTLRRYPVLRQLHSSEAANDLIGLICSETCSQKQFGPGEKVYVVDEVSRGMYFLTYGKFELREYRDDDTESFKVCAPPPHSAGVSTSVSKQGRVSAISPATIAWLSEFALFWQRTHDTMLIAESYCEILQVNRRAFLAVLQQFPVLQEALTEANQSRYDHAKLMMESESAVGDWIRPRSCYRESQAERAQWKGVVSSEAMENAGGAVEAACKTTSSRYWAGGSRSRGSSDAAAAGA
jgi:CRP-like cAMP-binding protein